MMYILSIVRAIKNITVNESKAVFFENSYKQIGFSEENSYYSLNPWEQGFFAAFEQLRETVLNPCNSKNAKNHL